jgi:hypothetical protein
MRQSTCHGMMQCSKRKPTKKATQKQRGYRPQYGHQVQAQVLTMELQVPTSLAAIHGQTSMADILVQTAWLFARSVEIHDGQNAAMLLQMRIGGNSTASRVFIGLGIELLGLIFRFPQTPSSALLRIRAGMTMLLPVCLDLPIKIHPHKDSHNTRNAGHSRVQKPIVLLRSTPCICSHQDTEP